ncbi:cupin domain-containing protein [Paenibacillus lutrae]|uniref:Cupin domain-containing protein n=1 Tax=Paenibacillus lutrae TaxID=2078573 RepID=A0A7X3FM02_9BACL|nr:cupin domain-containing protein [Paenibacillus lutrae]MVP01954.1 cupin domain-containing protein [Paenibacillus lutrae]
MNIQYASKAETSYEYGCDLRRIYPWESLIDPLWGSAIASVRAGENTAPHAHDEHETFIILKGRGLMTIEDETAEVSSGDIIYIPPNLQHTIRNSSEEERLEFITIYWGIPEANERMLRMAEELVESRTSRI